MRRFLAILVVCIQIVAGCKQSPRAATGPRIVSLSPSTTEALFAIGAGSEVVGRSRYCDYPAEAKALPEVGGFADPSLERILGLAPTLVVGARGPAGAGIAEQLQRRGVRTSFPPAESWDDVAAMLRTLGEETGHAARAQEVASALEHDTAAVEAEFRDKPRPRVLLVFGLAPVIVAGPGGFPDEMARRANAENVVREGGAYPALAPERLVALDPDVIVNMAMEERGSQARIANAPVWRELRAVREGHVAEVNDDSTLRPGPRLAAGLRVLGRAIHEAGDAVARERHP